MKSESLNGLSKDAELQDVNLDLQRTQCDSESKCSVNSYKNGEKVDFASAEPPYSLLNYNQAWGLVVVISLASFCSSILAPSVFPAIKKLEKEFLVSEQYLNLLFVSQYLFQAIMPLIFGGIADVYGRRPVIIFGLFFFVISSIGIALSRSFIMIILLRCIQSSSISPSVVINYGIIRDFSLQSQRGTFVGVMSGLSLAGQALGPLIGATLTAAYSWRLVFWFLASVALFSLLMNVFLLPETNRGIVGNLSIRPTSLLNISPLILLHKIKKQFRFERPDHGTLLKEKPKSNILGGIKILSRPEVIIICLPPGFQFALWSLSLTTLARRLQSHPYNFSLMTTGVCFLPSGLAGLFGSLVTGRLVDIFHNKLRKRFFSKKQSGQLPVDARFNIIRARVFACLPQNFIAAATFSAFGWSIDEGTHLSIILPASAASSFCTMSTLSTLGTLIIDLYPQSPCAAASCLNLVRFLMAALLFALYPSIQHLIGLGGMFTLISGFIFVSTLMLFFPLRHGMDWRRKRELRESI